MREPTCIQAVCCKCASKNFVQLKTWNDKFSVRFQRTLSGSAVDSIKETVVPLGKKCIPVTIAFGNEGNGKRRNGEKYFLE